MTNQPNKLKAISIFLVLISLVLIGFIFYKTTQTGQVNYWGYAVGVVCLLIGLFPLLFNRKV